MHIISKASGPKNAYFDHGVIALSERGWLNDQDIRGFIEHGYMNVYKYKCKYRSV